LRARIAVRRRERQRQPVEEAPPLACALDEQPVHRRREPQDGQPFRQRGRGGGCAVDAHDPPLGRVHLCAGREIYIAVERGGDTESARPALPRHLAKTRAPQAPAGREKRHRLEDVGLARAVLAGQHHEPRTRR
jgi:hypothetical protein